MRLVSSVWLCFWGVANAFALIALYGCASPPTYTESTVQAPALIVGTEQADSDRPMRTYIHAIEGAVIADGHEGWDKPLAVSPGRRVLRLIAVQGEQDAGLHIAVTLKAGVRYRVVAKPLASEYANKAQFWIEAEESGTVVSEKKGAVMSLRGKRLTTDAVVQMLLQGALH